MRALFGLLLAGLAKLLLQGKAFLPSHKEPTNPQVQNPSNQRACELYNKPTLPVRSFFPHHPKIATVIYWPLT